MSSFRILVVDDEPPILDVLSLMLRELGHFVGLAGGGVDALALFQSSSWDMVLTDRMMPGMSGEDLARQLKELSPGLPVVMVTGFVPQEPEGTIDAVVRKPFTCADLNRAIQTCLMAA